MSVTIKSLVWILILFSFSKSYTYAQPYTSQNQAAIKLYEKGLASLKGRAFEEAIESFEKAIQKDSTFAEVHFRLANDIYKIYKLTDKMIYHYDKAIKFGPKNKKFAAAYPIIIELKLKNGEYSTVQDLSQDYLSFGGQEERATKWVQKLYKDSQFAQEAIQNPVIFNPEAMPSPLNEFFLQYFPVLTADQQAIFFTARKAPTTAQPDSEENIYISYNRNGTWSTPESLSENINSTDNEGTCTISADGKVLVFTGCYEKGVLNYGRCDLYMSFREGDEWSVPVNLGRGVNSEAWESQPSLSADGKLLYFVSDRKSGLGQRDIYISRRGPDGVWGSAVNAGNVINTEWDELSPFIHPNGKTLYFSSRGHVGLGGFDLFQSEFQQGQFSFPKNLGYPLNTFQDQVSLFVSADGTKAYYSLEKTRLGKYISSILQVFDVPEEIKPSFKSNYVKGYVYDSETQKRLGAFIDLYDLTSQEIQETAESDAVSGEYLIVLNSGAQYALNVSKEGYTFKSMSFNFTEEKNIEPLEINIALDPLKAGTVFVLKNIFFAPNSFEIESKSMAELEELIKFMHDNKFVKGEISGHTDDLNSDDYNMTLSLNRAKSVFDFLLSKGIEPGRLTYKGYGESQPAVPNVSDENRAQNRRIEFKIL